MHIGWRSGVEGFNVIEITKKKKSKKKEEEWFYGLYMKLLKICDLVIN